MAIIIRVVLDNGIIELTPGPDNGSIDLSIGPPYTHSYRLLTGDVRCLIDALEMLH